MEHFLENIIPLFAIFMVFGIPMVAILTAHQRKMAELYHRGNDQQTNAEMLAMRREMMELKQLVHQLTISVDGLASRPAAPPIQERLEQGPH